MKTTDRTMTEYNPYQDLRNRYPGWKLTIADLGGIGEMICYRERLILIDEGVVDRTLLVAHVLAHLDLHLGQMSEQFTEDQESDAEGLALMRLDREPE